MCNVDMTRISEEESYFMASILLCQTAHTTQIDLETTKLYNESFEIYIKNDRVILVVDRRNPNTPRMYQNIQDAYNAYFK